MKILEARHMYPEKNGFKIERPTGAPDANVFVHFLTRVRMELDGKTIDVEPYTCILYDREAVQRWTALESLVHDWIHIDGDVDKYMKKYSLEYNHLYKLNDPIFVTQLVNEIEVEFFRGQKYSEQLISNKIEELFIGISRNNLDSAKTENSRKREFERLRLEVFSNLSKPWNVEAMSKLVSMSSSRFFTIYKDIFGVSPINDLIQARVHAAKSYLSDTDYSVSDVAELLGYSNEYHFIRQFRQITGMSPGKYSKTHNV